MRANVSGSLLVQSHNLPGCVLWYLTPDFSFWVLVTDCSPSLG